MDTHESGSGSEEDPYYANQQDEGDMEEVEGGGEEEDPNNVVEVTEEERRRASEGDASPVLDVAYEFAAPKVITAWPPFLAQHLVHAAAAAACLVCPCLRWRRCSC